MGKSTIIAGYLREGTNLLEGSYAGLREAGPELRIEFSRYGRDGTLQPIKGPALAGNQGGTAKQPFVPGVYLGTSARRVF